MATVEDGHVVLFRHLVDSSEKGEEVLLRVDILLTVSRKEDILALLQTKTLMNIACLNLREVAVENFCHR